MLNITLNKDNSSIKLELNHLNAKDALQLATQIQELLDNTLMLSTIKRRCIELFHSNGDSKLFCVKAIKEEFGLGLKESKETYELHTNHLYQATEKFD